MRGGPPAPFTLYVTAGTRPVRRAMDHAGRDVTERLARIDRRYVDELPVLPIRGYAEPHALTLDLGDADAGRRWALCHVRSPRLSPACRATERRPFGPAPRAGTADLAGTALRACNCGPGRGGGP